MASVYDILLELPMFKGIGREHLPALLAKTHLDFKTVSPCSSLGTAGEDCSTVRCVLSGRFEKITKCIDGRLIVREKFTAPATIGLENLFGLDTTLRSDFRSLTECSMMEFPKMQLVSLLTGNEMCLINMLNYLSAAAQRPSAAWRTKPTSDLIGNLQCLLAAVGASGRGSLFLESTSCPVAELLCEDIDISLRQEQDLLSMRLIEKEDTRKWKITGTLKDIADFFSTNRPSNDLPNNAG